MNKNRLKLYDDLIYTYLRHKDKVKFRNIAFRNKMTISELSRHLILFIIKIDEKKKLDSKINFSDNELKDMINYIGGMLNH